MKNGLRSHGIELTNILKESCDEVGWEVELEETRSGALAEQILYKGKVNLGGLVYDFSLGVFPCDGRLELEVPKEARSFAESAYDFERFIDRELTMDGGVYLIKLEGEKADMPDEDFLLDSFPDMIL